MLQARATRPVEVVDEGVVVGHHPRRHGADGREAVGLAVNEEVKEGKIAREGGGCAHIIHIRDRTTHVQRIQAPAGGHGGHSRPRAVYRRLAPSRASIRSQSGCRERAIKARKEGTRSIRAVHRAGKRVLAHGQEELGGGASPRSGRVPPPGPTRPHSRLRIGIPRGRHYKGIERALRRPWRRSRVAG